MVSRQEIVHKGRAVLSEWALCDCEVFVCPLFEALVSSVQLQQCWRGAGVSTTHTSLNHESGGWRGPITLYIVDMEQMVTLYIVDIWSPCTL